MEPARVVRRSGRGGALSAACAGNDGKPSRRREFSASGAVERRGQRTELEARMRNNGKDRTLGT